MVARAGTSIRICKVAALASDVRKTDEGPGSPPFDLALFQFFALIGKVSSLSCPPQISRRHSGMTPLLFLTSFPFLLILRQQSPLINIALEMLFISLAVSAGFVISFPTFYILDPLSHPRDLYSGDLNIFVVPSYTTAMEPVTSDYRCPVNNIFVKGSIDL